MKFKLKARVSRSDARTGILLSSGLGCLLWAASRGSYVTDLSVSTSLRLPNGRLRFGIHTAYN